MELISVNGEEMSYKYGNEMLHICGSVLQIICLTNETVRHKNGVLKHSCQMDDFSGLDITVKITLCAAHWCRTDHASDQAITTGCMQGLK